jgi:hypothetical protein
MLIFNGLMKNGINDGWEGLIICKLLLLQNVLGP